MAAPNRNTLWAETFVDELARAGLKTACIAPGSRSTPLTVAFANHPDIIVYSLLDERGAAFFALGSALATGHPAALVCTSGTATANFYPAIIEADSASVPLLVLTTDRPHELRHSGANQTVDQVKLYGDHVRWFVDAALPETGATPLRSLRTLANRALAATMGLPPGPVHLNFPFRKPLEPAPDPDSVPDPSSNNARLDGSPFTHISRGVVAPTDDQIHDLLQAVTSARRGLIICGPRCPGGDFPAVVTTLAQRIGFPIFADALSGVRFGPHTAAAAATIFSGYETFLQNDVTAGWESPDLILRFGAMPISKMLGQYIAANAASRHIQVSHTGVWQDDTHTTSDFVWADPEVICLTLIDRLNVAAIPTQDTPWREQLRRAEELTWQSLAQIQQESWFEGQIFVDIFKYLPQNSTLFSASSLPVRHLDQFCKPNNKNIRVYANRGASGIDGVVACALGVAAAIDDPLVLVVGDLSFYHDLNSLLAVKRCGVPLTIVVINNNGGGIFHRLPISQFDPPFTDLFVTPHGLNFGFAARLFGIEYSRVSERDEFCCIFSESVAQASARIIEVTTDAVHHENVRRQIIAHVTEILNG